MDGHFADEQPFKGWTDNYRIDKQGIFTGWTDIHQIGSHLPDGRTFLEDGHWTFTGWTNILQQKDIYRIAGH